MNVLTKERYEVPDITVVKVKTEGIICDSVSLQWMLTEPNAIPSEEWSRNGYGPANEL